MGARLCAQRLYSVPEGCKPSGAIRLRSVPASRVEGVISRYGQLNRAVTFLLMALNQSISLRIWAVSLSAAKGVTL